MVIRTILVIVFALFSITARAQVPEAKVLWTISNDDCIGLHMHGPTWLQCGFQDWAINADQSRILTVSTDGKVQLWTGDGKQLVQINWRDGWMKAMSSYSNASVKIIGNIGVAIVNRDDLVVFDMEDGEIRLKKTLNVMKVSELRANDQGRLFARVDDKEWKLSYREISLVDGALGPELPALPNDWQIVADGRRHARSGLNEPPHATASSCWFLDQSACVQWPIGSRSITIVNPESGAKRSIKATRKRTSSTFIRVVRAGTELVASICTEGSNPYPPMKDCDLLNLGNGQKFHTMKAAYTLPFGALDEVGRSEIRMLTGYENGAGYRAIRVGMDGTERLIGEHFAGAIALQDNGMIVGSSKTPTESRVIGPDGRILSTFPISPYSFGYNYESVPTNNLLSTAQRKWLVSVSLPPPADRQDENEDMEINNAGLSLFDISP